MSHILSFDHEIFPKRSLKMSQNQNPGNFGKVQHSPFTAPVVSTAATTTPNIYPSLPQVVTTAGAAISESLTRTVTVVTTALAGVHMTTKGASWNFSTNFFYGKIFRCNLEDQTNPNSLALLSRVFQKMVTYLKNISEV